MFWCWCHQINNKVFGLLLLILCKKFCVFCHNSNVLSETRKPGICINENEDADLPRVATLYAGDATNFLTLQIDASSHDTWQNGL